MDNKRKPNLYDLGDVDRAVKRRRHDDEEVNRRVALDIKKYLESLSQPAPGGEQLEEALPEPPAVPSPPPPPLASPPSPTAGPAPPRRRRRQPNLVPSASFPGPPQDDAEMEQRIRERARRLAAKQRLDDLFARIRAACPGLRVTRALFDRKIKDLVGDQSPAEHGIDLDAIPAPGSREEALVTRRYRLAREVALNERKRSITDRYIELAIRHLPAP